MVVWDRVSSSDLTIYTVKAVYCFPIAIPPITKYVM